MTKEATDSHDGSKRSTVGIVILEPALLAVGIGLLLAFLKIF